MRGPEPIPVLIVDDHPVVRDGLRRIEQLDPGLRIVGEADTVLAAVAATQRLGPQAVVMDVRLPDGSGIEACRQIKARHPETRILLLTSYADNHLVLAAMEAGADGYLLKESGAQRIVDALQVILGGGTVFDPIAQAEAGAPGRGGRKANPLERLTDQERRILAEVARGRTDKEVAAALGLTAKTARNYLDRIFGKLDVHTRTEAAMLHARWSDPAGEG